MGNSIGKTFWSVLGWTLIWAVLATFLNYILGMILAIVINRKTTRIKGFWRFCFYALRCNSAVRFSSSDAYDVKRTTALIKQPSWFRPV